MDAASLRIDKLLWYIRLAKTRELARQWAEAGHIRLNGRRIERASAAVRAGDVVVLPLRGSVWAIEIVAIPARRGPAGEAQACYRHCGGDHAPGDNQAGLTQPPTPL